MRRTLIAPRPTAKSGAKKTGIRAANHILGGLCPILACAPFGHRNVTVTPERLVAEEEVCRFLPDVLIVLSRWVLGRCREWLTRMGMERRGQFIEADHWEPLIQGTGVDREDVFHPPTELGILLGRDAPLLLRVRPQPIICA